MARESCSDIRLYTYNMLIICECFKTTAGMYSLGKTYETQPVETEMIYNFWYLWIKGNLIRF